MSYLETYNAGEFGSGGAGGVAALDVADSVNWSFPSFQIPADARGPMTIVVTAIDGAGREASADPIDLDVTSPLSIAVVGSGVVPPGGTLASPSSNQRRSSVAPEPQVVLLNQGDAESRSFRDDEPRRGVAPLVVAILVILALGAGFLLGYAVAKAG